MCLLYRVFVLPCESRFSLGTFTNGTWLGFICLITWFMILVCSSREFGYIKVLGYTRMDIYGFIRQVFIKDSGVRYRMDDANY